MMTEQVTSVEQSRRLLELGVPEEKASMVWVRNGSAILANNEVLWGDWRLTIAPVSASLIQETQPAFTVADLLGMLPEKMEYKGRICGCALKKGRFGYNIEYDHNLSNFSITFATYDTPIDAAIYTVEWIAKNGYPFTNTIVLTDIHNVKRVYRRLSEAEFM